MYWGFLQIILKHIFNPRVAHSGHFQKSLFTNPVASNLNSSKSNCLWEHHQNTCFISLEAPMKTASCHSHSAGLPVLIAEKLTCSQGLSHTPLKDGCPDRGVNMHLQIWISTSKYKLRCIKKSFFKFVIFKTQNNFIVFHYKTVSNEGQCRIDIKGSSKHFH